MGTREEKLESMGYALSDTPKAAGLYTPVVIDNGIAYASGMVPFSRSIATAKGSMYLSLAMIGAPVI